MLRCRHPLLKAPAVLLVAACGALTDPGAPSSADRTLYATVTGAELAPGDTTRIGVVLREGRSKFETPPVQYDWPQGLTVEWQSSDPRVASVDALGLVTAGAPGVATIRARVRDRSDTATVRVAGAGAIAAPMPLSRISAGWNLTCAVASAGGAYCWGNNWNGELGIGAARPYTATVSPVSVAGGSRFIDVVTGEKYACALASGGVPYCWGNYGPVGAAVIGYRPVRVPDAPTLVQVTAGADHTCGLTTSGAVYCWGFNYFGELGTGVPRGALSLRARVVAGGPAFRQIAAGASFTCGLTAAGATYCWGANEFGQLGTGVPGASAVPVPVAGGLTFVSITAGSLHMCAVTVAGAAYCWGRNNMRQLGGATGDFSPVPVVVQSGLAFRQLSAGADFNCGVATDDAAYCWGSNGNGQLGTGVAAGLVTPVNGPNPYIEPVPVRVAARLGWSLVTSGAKHTCGVARDGQTYCWGANAGGELGIGRRLYDRGVDYPVKLAASTAPVPIRGPYGVGP